MSLTALHKENTFGVGDTVRVVQRIKEGDKERNQAFEGIVIGIKGRQENKTITIRRIGAQQVGIERIFPLSSPTIENIDVVRHGTKGVRRAKLYYIREKAKREVENIYSRAAKKQRAKEASKFKSAKKSKPSLSK